MEDQIVWVAGEVLSEDGWQVLGVFDSEQAAIACCELPCDFVAPLPMGKILTRDEKGWPGLYFPKRVEYYPKRVEYYPKRVEYYPKRVEYYPKRVEYLVDDAFGFPPCAN